MMDINQITIDAEQGDAEAQFKLGAMYYDGILFAKDIEKAMYWLEKAAAAGNVNAMIYVSIHWFYEVDDEHKNHIGRLWGMAAAATGNSNAQFNYAARLHNGDGGLAETRRALRYYRFSARQGNVDAQCYLATALIEGDGGTQDVVKGVELLNEAIELGSVAAFYHAGHYLLDGEFVEQDIDLAHKFFTEASKKGRCLADEVLENWDEYTETC